MSILEEETGGGKGGSGDLHRTFLGKKGNVKGAAEKGKKGLAKNRGERTDYKVRRGKIDLLP